MLAFCPAYTLWDPSTLETLMADVLDVSYVLIPLSICLAAWLYYRNRFETFTRLGLDEAATVSESPRCSWPCRLLYLSTLTLTFLIGVLTSHVSNLIQEVYYDFLK